MTEVAMKVMQTAKSPRFFLQVILTAALFTGSALAAPTDRAGKLEELKKLFPTHIAGQVTEQTDPIIRRCYLKYKQAVASLTLENLPEMLADLREELDDDIEFPAGRQNGEHVRTPSISMAERQNLNWLKQKMLPYLKRLESFQRGRLP